MNEQFVPIKVDREERPDLDQIYMDAVQLLTGRGGWPLTVFLTPEGEPFYGGTYFPPEDRQGMPGFHAGADGDRQRVSERSPPTSVRTSSGSRKGLSGLAEFNPDGGELRPDMAETGARALARALRPDQRRIWGTRPNFPTVSYFRFSCGCIRRLAISNSADMVRETLTKMAKGGIYDQLGGGFHRYSVDDRWLVPHFEKMLYDNALLARLYLDAGRALGEPRVPDRRARDSRLRAARDDQPRGRLLLDPGRGQRGRRGQVLRLDAR